MEHLEVGNVTVLFALLHQLGVQLRLAGLLQDEKGVFGSQQRNDPSEFERGRLNIDLVGRLRDRGRRRYRSKPECVASGDDAFVRIVRFARGGRRRLTVAGLGTAFILVRSRPIRLTARSGTGTIPGTWRGRNLSLLTHLSLLRGWSLILRQRNVRRFRRRLSHFTGRGHRNCRRRGRRTRRPRGEFSHSQSPSGCHKPSHGYSVTHRRIEHQEKGMVAHARKACHRHLLMPLSRGCWLR